MAEPNVVALAEEERSRRMEEDRRAEMRAEAVRAANKRIVGKALDDEQKRRIEEEEFEAHLAQDTPDEIHALREELLRKASRLQAKLAMDAQKSAAVADAADAARAEKDSRVRAREAAVEAIEAERTRRLVEIAADKYETEALRQEARTIVIAAVESERQRLMESGEIERRMQAPLDASMHALREELLHEAAKSQAVALVKEESRRRRASIENAAQAEVAARMASRAAALAAIEEERARRLSEVQDARFETEALRAQARVGVLIAAESERARLIATAEIEHALAKPIDQTAVDLREELFRKANRLQAIQLAESERTRRRASFDAALASERAERASNASAADAASEAERLRRIMETKRSDEDAANARTASAAAADAAMEAERQRRIAAGK
eukprot:c38973_g1_i1.p1 GENE.c38973_g1_i1~~c38973_g1_i1.p1  ORF type:complete len:399 (-),score=93.62 c38973_g1_i1:52-1218(-)